MLLFLSSYLDPLRWSQQYGGDGFIGGSFRVPRVGGQRHSHIPAGLLMGGKGFPAPQPHPLFPLPPAAAAAAAASLGGLMSPRNSLPGLPSLGVGGLLSPQQFLAKRPSLQETPSEVSAHLCVFNLIRKQRDKQVHTFHSIPNRSKISLG